MQCLLHIPELNFYFINLFSNLNEDIKSKSIVSREYYNIVKEAYKNKINNINNINNISLKNLSNILISLNPKLKESNDEKDLLIY